LEQTQVPERILLFRSIFLFQNAGMKTANPHMWIPYQGPEPYDEVCGLCGVFSGAHHKKPDPPAAKLPCPEPWPEWPSDDEQRDGR
jgi:hypothetical protein